MRTSCWMTSSKSVSDTHLVMVWRLVLSSVLKARHDISDGTPPKLRHVRRSIISCPLRVYIVLKEDCGRPYDPQCFFLVRFCV